MTDTTPKTPPIVLSIAGSDSSGGAGIQADLKTFAAHHVYGATVITALTAQNTTGVKAIFPVTATFVAEQFHAVTSDLKVAAIKIGMLANNEIAQEVAASLKTITNRPIVIDPVMVATTGDTLLDAAAIQTLKNKLFPFATVLTPNRQEAAKLTGLPPFNHDEEAEVQARFLLELGCASVLMKGGHANASIARDLLVTADKTYQFDHPWIETHNTHGTGCTLSSAIAANLAHKQPLETAVRNAKEYVWRALSAAQNQHIGNGNGPIDHDFARFSPTKSR